jgi:tetratricopeptide (TPR) repeat protein
MRGTRIIAVLGACLMPLPGFAAVDPGGSCVPGYTIDDCGSAQRCKDKLSGDPYDVPVRIAVCEALVADGDLLDAMVVLREGLETCGGRSYACSQMQIALSNVEELADKDTPDLRAERRREQEFKRQYCLGPSASDESIRACNEALLSYVDEGALYEALGAKYQRRGQPAQALQNLRQAAELLPGDDGPRQLLNDAEQARRELVDACLSERDLASCDAAILPGEPDEFDLQQRRAQLLLGQDRRAGALQAFLTAQSLAPEDVGVATSLLPLVGEALQGAPEDPELHGARAAALAATGQIDRGIREYRRVLALNPEDDNASRRLGALRDARREQLETQCFGGEDVGPCRTRLIPGEPDEQHIREHIAEIEAAQELRRALADAPEPSAGEPDAVPALEAQTPDQPEIEPPSYQNVAATDGSTH